MVDKYNFNVVPNDEQEEFTVDFGETIKVVENDFNQLENRPSYNGTPMTGDTNIPEVPSAVSQLTNDADYQTGADVQSSISSHNESEEAHPYLQGLIGEKQDQLTAGTNISIDNNVISATDTRYSAGNGLNLSSENAFSVDTTVVATQQNLANEVTNRENADNALQAQIDGISASSDVVDIVGTYAELQQYDTQHLKDNDIIKVLQDETQGGATTYYRWSTTTSTFTLIGQEGPYYTKAAADSQFVPQTRTVNGKALSSNITLNASDVSALSNSDVVQTTGSSTSQVMSQNAVTTQLNTKLDASDYVVDTQLADSTNPVQNKVINNLLGDMPADFFTAGETVSGEGTNITLNNTISAPLKSVELDGDTYQQTYSGANLFNFRDTRDVGTVTTVSDDGFITQSKDNSSGTAQAYNNYFTHNLALSTSTYYTVVTEIQAVSGTGSLVPVGNHSTAQSQDQIEYPFTDLHAGDVLVARFRTKSTFTSDYGIRGYLKLAAGQSGSVTYRISILADTSITPETFVYQPFTGNMPSPNPDYPQDVQVVTGEQNVWVHGKNLLDLDSFVKGRVDNGVIGYADGTTSLTATDNSITFTTNTNYRGVASELIPVKPNVSYVFSSGTSSGFGRYTDFYDSSKNWISRATSNPSTTPANCAYARISFQLSSTGTITITNPQFEQGSATTFEPYQGNNYTISLGSIELCKIGDYQDYIYKSGDDWYVHKACGKLTLDGDENWTYNQVNAVFVLSENYPHTSDGIAPIANYFTGQANVTLFSQLQDKKCCALVSGDNNRLLFKYTSYTDANDFKTWLNSHNTIIYYAIATPTDTKITDSTLIGQLEALRNAKTNLGTTSFLTTAAGTNLPVILDIVAYRKSLAGMLGAIERLSE